MILEVTLERYPGQARYASTEGHSLDGAWENAPDMDHASNTVIASVCILDGAFLCRDESLCARLMWSAACRGVCRNLECTRGFVHGESAQCDCGDSHTVDGKAAK